MGGFIGGPAGARLGFSIGAVLGGVLENASKKPQDAGRLRDLQVTSSSYGSMIPFIWGRHRLGGNVVWWSDFRETSRKKGSKLTGTQTKVYSYSVDLGILVCRGPVTGIVKIFADDITVYDSSTTATSEVQTISVGTNVSGSFTVTFRSVTSAGIAANATAATVQSTLTAMSSIGTGNIAVTGPTAGPWVATFQGSLAGQNVPRMDMNNGTLSGGSGQGITTTFQGGRTFTIRVYLGTETQVADPTITAWAALQSPATEAPAYRGSCYVVMEDFPLAAFGNRLPNFTFLVENAPGTLLVSDSFNRADGNIGNADTGQAWQFVSFQGQITSNRAATTSSPGTPNWIDAGQSDGTALLTAALMGSLGVGSLVFRLTDESNYWRLFQSSFATDPTHWILRKVVAGSATDVVISTIVAAANDALKVVLSGATISAYINNVLAAQTTDSFNQTATNHGFSAPSDAGVDNFSFTAAAGTTNLKTILADVFAAVGITGAQYDLSTATDLVRGYMVTERTEARSVVEELLPYFPLDLVEGDGKLKSVRRGGAIAMVVDPLEMGAAVTDGNELEPKPPLSTSRQQELELPFRVDLNYISATNNYQSAPQGALRQTKTHLQEQLSLSTVLVLTKDEARAIAERLLYQAWTERERYETTVLPKYLPLLPGDCVTLTVAGSLVRARIMEMGLALPGPVALKLVLDEPAVLTQVTPGGDIPASEIEGAGAIATTLVAWNGNAARDVDADSVGLYLAANGSSAGFWSGAVIYLSRDSGASYQELETVEDPATFGTASTVLAAGTTTGLFDDTNTVDVLLTGGTDVPPITLADADVLAGANGVVIGDEYLQFGTVTALGGNSYRLSHLLRGRRGTDTFWDEHRTGERVVLDGAVKRVALPPEVGNGTINLKAVGNGQVLADVAAIPVGIYARETLEYAGVHPVGTRDGSLNLTVVWDRRVRKNGDLQPFRDVPLDVLVASYQTVILPATGTTITAVTRGTTTTITAAGHGLVAGDVAYMVGLGGILPLNNQTLVVLSVSGTSFTVDLDSSQYPAWTTGGTVRKPKRTLISPDTTVTYSAAVQVTDFGSTQSSVSVAIYAVGDDGRRGYPLVGSV